MLSSFYKKEWINIKVLVITTTFPRWKDDTRPPFIYEFSKRLSKELEITVLAPHCLNAKKIELMDGMKILRFIYFYPIKYQRLAYGDGILPNIKNSNLAKIQVPFLFISELLNAIYIVKKWKIDLICSHWLVPQGFIGAICKTVFGTPHVLTIHAADIFGLEHLPFKRKIGDYIVKNSDIINVVSSYIGERLLLLISPKLKKSAEQKLSVIPMGVHVEALRRIDDTSKLKTKYKIYSRFNLLFIGRFSEKKGIKYLIEAMPIVLSEIKDVSLILCGDGQLRPELENLVYSMGLESQVRFTGYVTNDEKIDYLNLADILIVPSIVTDSGDTEGLPVVILEGLASGKAIIASDISGVHDVITDGYNGLLIEQKNPGLLAKRILELINNPELFNGLSINALNSSKNYDWNIIGSKVLSSIKSISIEYAKN